MDPKNPGAVDEIIHLGDFWDEEGMRKNRDKIIKENRQVGRLFARAYRYLRAAACIYEDNSHIYEEALNKAKVNAVAGKIVDDVFSNENTALKVGKERHLFATAITPEGMKNFLESVVGMEKAYILKFLPGLSTENILIKVKNKAVENGCDVECYHCALFPEKLEHVVIPQLNTSFTTCCKYHSAEITPYAWVDFNDFMDMNVLEEYKDVLEYNSGEFEALLYKAIETIKLAKETHDSMEEYYIPNMDFEAVQRCRESVMQRILEYCK